MNDVYSVIAVNSLLSNLESRNRELKAEVAAHRELLIRWADMAQHMGLGETNLHRESKALLEGKSALEQE